MVKKLFKGALCAALSLSMALGSVMVGASEDVKLKEQVTSIETTQSGISNKMSSMDVKPGKLSVMKSSKTGKAIARSVQNATAYLAYNASTVNKVSSDIANVSGNWIGGQTTTDENTTMTVNITLQKAGYLYVAYIGADSTGNNPQNTGVSLYQGTTEVGYDYGTSGTLKSKRALPRGTYKLVVKAKAGTTGVAIVYPWYVTTENIGMATSSKLIVGNGGNIVQTFSIKKRSQVWIDADKAGYGYIQKRSGSKWTTVSNRNYFYNSAGKLERSYYALSAGSYCFVMKPSAGNFVEFKYGARAYTGKYATKKSKAIKISRKKSKTNVLTASDANKKTHYYKIKVTSKRKTQINVTTYQTGGNLKVTIYGKGLRTITRTMTSSQVRKFVSSGKLRKGTYYIKISKIGKNTSGRYTIKYVK